MKLDITEIKHNPYNSRENYGELGGLDKSIDRFGLLHPFIVRKNRYQEYELVFGHRRLYVLKQKGIKKVNVQIKNLEDNDMASLAICENLHRKDLEPLELAQAFEKGVKASGGDIEKFAESIGYHHQTIRTYLSLLNLPQEIKNKSDSFSSSELCSMADIASLPKEILYNFEQRLENEELPTVVTTQITRGVKKVYALPIPEKQKQKLAFEIIDSEYKTGMGLKAASEIRKTIDFKLEQKVAELSKSKPKTVERKLINYDNELEETILFLQRFDKKLTYVFENKIYDCASVSAQKTFDYWSEVVLKDVQKIFKKSYGDAKKQE